MWHLLRTSGAKLRPKLCARPSGILRNSVGSFVGNDAVSRDPSQSSPEKASMSKAGFYGFHRRRLEGREGVPLKRDFGLGGAVVELDRISLLLLPIVVALFQLDLHSPSTASFINKTINKTNESRANCWTSLRTIWPLLSLLSSGPLSHPSSSAPSPKASESRPIPPTDPPQDQNAPGPRSMTRIRNCR